MYYEERVIDGVLHWRGTPNGRWLPLNAAELTVMLLAEREKVRAAREAPEAS